MGHIYKWHDIVLVGLKLTSFNFGSCSLYETGVSKKVLHDH